MKSFLPLLFVLVLSLVFHNHAQAQDKTASEIVYLSGKDAGDPVMWDFQVSDGRKAGEWSKIPVPSHWEFHGFGRYNYGHDHSRKDRVLGKEVGHYRFEFEVPADWKDQVIRLVFGGSMTDTKVEVNGELAGPIHQGAFYEFSYEVTDLLKSGQTNLLEVEVAKHSANASINRAERQADFWIFGGIFRPVYLEILPKTHFSRIAINPLADGDFSALLKTNRKVEDGEVQVELVDLSDGKALGSTNMKFQGDSVWIKDHFPEVTAWNPETPQLYEAKFTLLEKGEPVFTAKETIGFRTVELRENDGIYVNGTRVVFKGVNRHSSYPTTGRALSRANHLEDIFLMKEMNMNAVRMSHYPPDEEFLHLCDSLGLFVLDEVTG